MTPLYVDAMQRGFLSRRVEESRRRLEECDLCPRRCGVNRLAGEVGTCRGGAVAEVSSAGPHFGEEPPLVGWGGSGTIFLTNCGLRCIFCQNFDISHLGRGLPASAEDLGKTMLELQGRGCHNINFVTPTHYLPQILEALEIAAEGGLGIPLVWNCSGYESVDALRLLEGIVDIYMPDAKFSTEEGGRRYCGVEDYWEKAKGALLEMHRQVGDLVVGDEGTARRGLLVRHLVLPGGRAGTSEVTRFIAEEVSPHTWVNMMDQYRPCFRATEFQEIARRLSGDEYAAAASQARRSGLHRGIL